MKTYYYLGWFNHFFPEKLVKKLAEDITDRKSIVMISSEPSSNELDGKIERSWLEDANIHFEEYYLINYSIDKEQAQSLIRKASAIFLLGGNTIELNRFLNEYELSNVIKNSSGVVIGASAGAINMSKKWWCSKSFGYLVEKPILYDGIGLNNFSVISHFDLENNFNAVEMELAPLSKSIDIYLSNKDCAIRVKEGKLDIIGDVYLFSQNVITKLNETI